MSGQPVDHLGVAPHRVVDQSVADADAPVRGVALARAVGRRGARLEQVAGGRRATGSSTRAGGPARRGRARPRCRRPTRPPTRTRHPRVATGSMRTVRRIWPVAAAWRSGIGGSSAADARRQLAATRDGRARRPGRPVPSRGRRPRPSTSTTTTLPASTTAAATGSSSTSRGSQQQHGHGDRGDVGGGDGAAGAGAWRARRRRGLRSGRRRAPASAAAAPWPDR